MTRSARARVQPRVLPVILDADAITKVARRDQRVRAMLRRLATQQGAVLVVPLVGVTQALAQGTGERAGVSLIRPEPTDRRRCRGLR